MNAPLQHDFEAAHGRDLAENADVYRTLLESTNAIPWKLDWPALNFAYIGPQIEKLLGWAPESWLSVEDWATRMHPEDRDRAVSFCVAQSQAGVDHEVDYRALKMDGDYVWMRDVVHVVRGSDGEVQSLIGFMFDISERKLAEEELLRLHRELEALSQTDALTGIANRRMFDQRLDTEWMASRRSGQPLSLLLIDIDWFKPYNDTYGHVAGDECIQCIALVLKAAARRPRDVAARLGGDEFVLLLPDTDEAKAHTIAHDYAEAIAALRMPHGVGGAGAVVSASIGIATRCATEADEPRSLLEAADEALYAAKRHGRGGAATG
ncbi:MAG: diguanylate cyclase [Lysobacter sp.]|nr:MAG: diguanylate cyclase [Lysobacter sp.]